MVLVLLALSKIGGVWRRGSRRVTIKIVSIYGEFFLEINYGDVDEEGSAPARQKPVWH